MENTDFVIEHIDEEVQVIADQPSVVTNYPANTDFFIENIDSNVISIAHSLNIEASEVDFRPANTDFFIENIDKNVIAIAESMSLTPSEVDFRPANTDFFVENIDKNLIEIAESLSLTPYEVTIRPANTDMFIENIDKNVTLIKGSTNVVTVSGEYININIPDGGKVQSAQIDGNATQQTYSGKNLISFPASTKTYNGVTWTITDTVITGMGTSSSNWSLVTNDISFGEPLPAGTYTFSIPQTLGKILQLTLREEDNTAHDYDISAGSTSVTFTTTFTAVKYRLAYRAEASTALTFSMPNRTQLEKSSSVTDYEPYVGGIPSPNPDYPQDINVVTGKQTIDINGTSYPINLGDIWLAKIGTYQDRIYKEGEKWYVEKQIDKITYDGTENWNAYSTGTVGGDYAYSTATKKFGFDGSNFVPKTDYICDHATQMTYGELIGTTVHSGIGSTQYATYLKVTSDIATTKEDFATWLASNPTTVYYALATPTTTEITDQTLIDQLEALASAPLNQGVNNIFTEIATGNAMPTLKLVIEKY